MGPGLRAQGRTPCQGTQVQVPAHVPLLGSLHAVAPRKCGPGPTGLVAPTEAPYVRVPAVGSLKWNSTRPRPMLTGARTGGPWSTIRLAGPR